MRRMRARAGASWERLTFATRNPARRVGALTALGAVSGLGEAAIVVLVVSLASRGIGGRLPFVGHLPDGTWSRAGIALGVLVVLAASHYVSAWLAARVAGESQETARRLLVGAYMGADWPAQSRERTGQLQDLLTTAAGSVAIGTQQGAMGLTMIFNLFVVVVAAVIVSVWATLGLVAVACISLLVLRPFRARTRRIAVSAAEASGDLATDVTEVAQLAPELRVSGTLQVAQHRLDERIAAARRLFESLRLTATATPTLIRDVTMAVVIVAVAIVASRGDVSLPELGAAVLLLLRALSYAQGISGISAQLQERGANVDRIRDHLARWHASALPAGTRPCQRVGSIALDSISYTYPNRQRPALAGVSLVLEPGEHIGVVGRTGAGKSTLAQTVLGLLRPDQGQVLVDGVPLRDLRPEEWHRRIAWVRQEPRLLTGTVRRNIRFLREHVGDEAVHEAAEGAGLGPELESWPDGLDHDTGPAGAALSVGQRQRIVLARGLAGRPDLLVLDEPTSALDAQTEAAVRDTIARMRGRATVIVIAHRLSTLDACDRVAVLDDGRLAAVGPPGELAAAGGYYREALELSGMRP